MEDETDLSEDELLAMWDEAKPVELPGGPLVRIDPSPWVLEPTTGTCP